MDSVELLEKWLRKKMAVERRDARRGMLIAISFGLLATIFAFFVVQGVGVLIGMILAGLGLAGLLGYPLFFLYIFGAFVVYPLTLRRAPRELVALGRGDDAPQVSLPMGTVGLDQFRDPLEPGPRFGSVRLFLAIPLAPPVLFGLALSEFRLIVRTGIMDYRGCALLLDQLLRRAGRVQFEDLAELLPDVNLRRVVPDVVCLSEVHSLVNTRPPGLTLTPGGREVIGDFIASNGGEVPLAQRIEQPRIPEPRPRTNELLDLPPETERTECELPPRPGTQPMEGVLSDPVLVTRRDSPATGFDSFALMNEAGHEQRLEPVMPPPLPSSAEPASLALVEQS